MFCRQQAAAFMGIKGQLDQTGVALVAIGSGTPQQAQDFAKKFKFEGELYVSQDLSAYKAFHLDRGFWLTLGPKSLWRGVNTLAKGFYQGLNAGDLWQQGGVFVMGPGKQMVYERRDNYAGDHANMQEVIDLCPIEIKGELVPTKTEEPVVPKEAGAVPKIEETISPKEAVVAVPVSSVQNETKSISKEDVRNLVNSWLASWQSGDMDTYRSFYAPDFQSKGMNLDAWVSHKADANSKSKNIKISIDDLQILVEEEIAHVSFIQNYSSSILKDSGKKMLKLKKINNEWKIYKEIM
jgi:ketosteroid isomerase-like protein